MLNGKWRDYAFFVFFIKLIKHEKIRKYFLFFWSEMLRRKPGCFKLTIYKFYKKIPFLELMSIKSSFFKQQPNSLILWKFLDYNIFYC